MPKLLAPCGKLCPAVCWWLPFPIVGIPFHLWYLGYINTFFYSFLVCSNRKNLPIKFLTQATMQPGKQFNASLMMGQDMMEQLAMMDFKHPTQVFPYVRCAIWATMQDGYAKILTKQGQAEGASPPTPSRRPAGQLMGSGHGPPCATKHRCQGIWQNGCQNHSLFDSQAENVQGGQDLTAILVQFSKDVQGNPTRHQGDQCDWCQPTGHCFPPSWAHEDPWHAPLLNWFFCLDGTMAFSWIRPPRSLLPP